MTRYGCCGGTRIVFTEAPLKIFKFPVGFSWFGGFHGKVLSKRCRFKIPGVIPETARLVVYMAIIGNP